MANIAITTYCNLACPYCIADDMICKQEKKNISVSRFQEILSWLSKTPLNRVGIIGGEPTLHPNFDEILKVVNRFCAEFNTYSTIFTNAICLDRWIDNVGPAVRTLINLTNPNDMTPAQYRSRSEVLEHINQLGWFVPPSVPSRPKAMIGCNIYLEEDRYEWLWETVDRYQIDRVRTSVVAPGGRYMDWRFHKEEYYTALKPAFLNFCKEAKKRDIPLSSDCNQIPDCYFTDRERWLVDSVMRDRHRGICKPVVDITPDFKSAACFGSYEPVDCRDFENLMELEQYLYRHKSFPLVEKNCTGKCATCKQHLLMNCQGGCLSFSGNN